ncbi:hypothetical protein AB0A91_13390 [Streptomyces sp. NPDC042207]|uniref:hypothetical protein n=1 Tax=Streptomyces sp. NPDC042207 TaxID=3154331 RepID=UPI0033EC93C4
MPQTQTQTQTQAVAPGPARTSVLVVLENELVRCGVTSMLRTVPSVQDSWACSGPVAARELLAEHRPDIVLCRGSGELAPALIAGQQGEPVRRAGQSRPTREVRRVEHAGGQLPFPAHRADPLDVHAQRARCRTARQNGALGVGQAQSQPGGGGYHRSADGVPRHVQAMRCHPQNPGHTEAEQGVGRDVRGARRMRHRGMPFALRGGEQVEEGLLLRRGAVGAGRPPGRRGPLSPRRLRTCRPGAPA